MGLHLFRGDQCMDTFSVCPQYWSDPPQATAIIFEGGTIKRFVSKVFGPRLYKDPEEKLRTWSGKPDVLASLWGLPRERIERYLVNWGFKIDPDDEMTFEYTLTGRAYPDDEHDYGDYEQFFDVLRALGAVDPVDQHTLRLPKAAR